MGKAGEQNIGGLYRTHKYAKKDKKHTKKVESVPKMS